MLSVLGLLHSVLPGADQAQQISPVANSSDNAMAEGRKQRANGQFAEALRSFQRSAAAARQSGDASREAQALTAASAVEIRLLDCAAAAESALRAKQLALQAKNETIAGAAAGNLSAVFAELGDFDRAKTEAAEAVEHLKTSSNKSFYARAWLSLATLDFDQKNNAEGERAFQQAITAAHAARDAILEATAWDDRGFLLLDQAAESKDRDLVAAAAESLEKAYLMRRNMGDEPDIPVSKVHLAELELQKPHCNCQMALQLIDQALSSPNSRIREIPPFFPIHIRAKILEKLGDPAALQEYRRAVLAAADWRQSTLPGDITNTRTVAWLQNLFADFARIAAETSLRRNDRALAAEALEVLAANRAANLREQLAATFGRKMQLPPEYFEILSRLQQVQAQVILGGNTKEDRDRLQIIRNNLQDLEDNIGLSNRLLRPYNEKNSLKNSLRDIQVRLGQQEVLLSFCLGEEKSFLWSVTRTGFNLYELAKRSEIEEAAKLFAEDVRLGRDARESGQKLSRNLFSQLPPRIRKKPEWLVVGDGGLLDRVPFSALPEIESGHSLRFLPSELLLLAPNKSQSSARFVGIADPIYNLADPRRSTPLLPVDARRPRMEPQVALARLAGSRREILSAAKWSGFASPELLTGAEANGERIGAALAKNPAIIHFAVHIVSPAGQPENAALALSLTKDDIPELLTPEIIATYRLPGSLVVLSGCASEQGKLLPGAGIIGLSRAWLLAGASAVIVSAWPTPDDSGGFFSSFYRHLQAIPSGPPAKRAAIALQQTQLEMQQQSGYRSSPAFWAAYSIISEE